MGLYRSPRHVELGGNLGIVTTLQKQVNDLLFAWTEPNSLFLHLVPLFLGIVFAGQA
jgi:hypothetical protein